MKPIELYKQFTSELSKLQNEILNTSIRSYESDVPKMTTEELYETAQELFWLAEDVTSEDDLLQNEYDEDWEPNENSYDEILDEADKILEELGDCV